VAVNLALRNSQLRGFEGSSLPRLIVEFVTGSDGNMYDLPFAEGSLWRLGFGAGAEGTGDLIAPGAGNDFVDGGGGPEIASLGSSDTLFREDGGTFAANAAVDKYDRLGNDETFRFDNADVNSPSPPASMWFSTSHPMRTLPPVFA
jgi:hypothetical protein